MKDQSIYRDIPAYYHPFLDLVGTDDLLEALEQSRNSTLELMDRITPEQEHFAYQPGKWTTNQVIRHIIDTERIFAYRALRFSRTDATELPGFDEKAYIDSLRGLDLRLADLKDEYGWVRGSTIALYRGMTPGTDPIHVRRIGPDDLETLVGISRLTFAETFAAENSEENLRKYLDEAMSMERLAAELQDPDSSFHFAEQGKEVVGYLKLNRGPAQTEALGDRALEVERIYVLRSHHGRGVAQVLLAEAIHEALALGADRLWLGVWERNLRAIRFYEKHGFVAFGKHLFRLGDEEQTDLLMQLILLRQIDGLT